MKGFDKEFRDLPDYIVRITEHIWEGRRVDSIRKYYGKKCPVRSPAGIVTGCEAVVAATLATLAEFPDRRLLTEDIVWSGDENAGFLSSHRILSTATHAGDGVYGRATGKPVCYRVIADCVVHKNQVVEEWLVRDQGAIARALGLTPRRLAQMQIAVGNKGFYAPQTNVAGAYKPRHSKDPAAVAYLALWTTLWRGDLSLLAARYHAAATAHAPGGAKHIGHAQIDRFFLGWLAAVAEAKFGVDELTTTENERGKTVAMRWTARGRHSGAGVFADSQKGAPLYIMGISHARFVGDKIMEEWTLIDEVALWKQILAPTKQTPKATPAKSG